MTASNFSEVYTVQGMRKVKETISPALGFLCCSRAVSLSTICLEHSGALSTGFPALQLAAVVLLIAFHQDNIETQAREQGEGRKKHGLVSRHLYSVLSSFPCHEKA